MYTNKAKKQSGLLFIFKEARKDGYSYTYPSSCQEVFATVHPFPNCVATVTNAIYLRLFVVMRKMTKASSHWELNLGHLA